MTFIDRISEGVCKLLIYLVGIIAVLTWMEVLLRYVAGSPTVWAPELIQASSAVVFLFAGSVAMSRDAHIRISFIFDQLPGAVRRTVLLLCLACALVFVGGLIYGVWNQFFEAVWRFNGSQWAPETTGRAWDVPLPPVTRFLMLVACVLFLAQACVTYVRAFATRD